MVQKAYNVYFAELIFSLNVQICDLLIKLLFSCVTDNKRHVVYGDNDFIKSNEMIQEGIIDYINSIALIFTPLFAAIFCDFLCYLAWRLFCYANWLLNFSALVYRVNIIVARLWDFLFAQIEISTNALLNQSIRIVYDVVAPKYDFLMETQKNHSIQTKSTCKCMQYCEWAIEGNN